MMEIKTFQFNPALSVNTPCGYGTALSLITYSIDECSLAVAFQDGTIQYFNASDVSLTGNEEWFESF